MPSSFRYWLPVFFLSPLLPIGVIVALPALLLLMMGDSRFDKAERLTEADSGEEMGSGFVDPSKANEITLYRTYESNDEGVLYGSFPGPYVRVPHALLKQLSDDGEPVNAIVLGRPE